MNTSLEKAIRFISDTLAENPGTNIFELVEKASHMFNLTPIEEEQLFRIHAGQSEKK